jgi:CubicO group peptidase (beta-lactamase class C family)
MKNLLQILIISIFLGCQYKNHAQINAGADFYLDGILKKLRTQFNVPSVCGTLVIDGKIVAFGATGVRKQGNAAQVKDDDLFAIGSVTKTITGFLAAKIIEENQNNTFTWSTRIRDMYPELAGVQGVSNVALNSSIQDLDKFLAPISSDEVSHASCSINNFPEGWCKQDISGVTENCSKSNIANYQICARDEFVNKIMRLPMAPYIVGKYNNNTPVIVSAMLQRFTNNTFENLLKERIFNPLGFSRAKLVSQVTDAELNLLPYGHDTSNNVVDQFRTDWPMYHVCHASGGVMMTPKEMGTYLIELMSEAENRIGILTKESLASYFSERSALSGKVNGGWFKLTVKNKVPGDWITPDTAYWHNGGTLGFGSDFLIIPDKKFGYACVNTGKPDIRGALQTQLVNMWYQKDFLQFTSMKTNATLSNATSLKSLSDNDFLTTWTSNATNDVIIAKPGGGRGVLSVPFKYILLAYPRDSNNIDKIQLIAKGFDNIEYILKENINPGRDNTLFILDQKTIAKELRIRFTNKNNKKTVLSEIKVIGHSNDRHIMEPIEKIMDPIKLIRDPVVLNRMNIISVKVPIQLQEAKNNY